MVEGDNDHHKAEAIFKAFAKALKQAVRASGSFELPTTKGTL
jgi:imidazoleglycerol phosphate dehydratase HisB